jgi:type I restriction enzyme M protein
VPTACLRLSQAHRGIRQLAGGRQPARRRDLAPSGVFKPYAGVSTAILIFKRGGRTDNEWFSGPATVSRLTTSDPVDENDLPDLATQWKTAICKHNNRAKKAFFNPVSASANNNNLSNNSYNEVEYEETAYEPPKAILTRLEELEVASRSN